MKKEESKLRQIFLELVHHLPFSIMGVVIALILMGVLTFIVKIAQAEQMMPGASVDLFHVFHPGHVLFSAVATTAMFWKHDNKSWFKAVIVGLVGSVTVCGVSDVLVPYVGGMLLGSNMHFHICILEEPGLVYPFVFVGILSGLAVTRTFEKSTEYSHSMHVFLSSVASLLYLISFGMVDWMHHIGQVFLITVFAVMFPCCLSDIIFPMMCSHKYCKHSKHS